MVKPKEKYRQTVAGIIINENKQILMCEHIWIDDAYQFPQGGINDNEMADKAIMRELAEELGTQKFIIVDKMPEKLKYVLPANLRKKYDLYGQEQRYFLLYFYGKDTEISFTKQNKPEFKSMKWVNVDMPVKEVVYFKKLVYLEAINYFKDKIKKLDINEIKKQIPK